MNGRLKAVRKTLNLTQLDFAKKVGISRSIVAAYEGGHSPISDRTIADVCRTFSVSEKWLRTGEGVMFKAQENINAMLSNDVARLVMSSDDFTKQLVHAYLSLPTETRATAYEFFKKVIAETEKQK
jgi:transcriptional regulator with XRE-family HTH domain